MNLTNLRQASVPGNLVNNLVEAAHRPAGGGAATAPATDKAVSSPPPAQNQDEEIRRLREEIERLKREGCEPYPCPPNPDPPKPASSESTSARKRPTRNWSSWPSRSSC